MSILIVWWWTAGCRWPCPPDAIRVAGRCQLVAGQISNAPLQEEDFADAYDRSLCDALEDCACEGIETGDCEIEVDCPDSDWPEGCTFDGEAARDCVNGNFSCDNDGGIVEIEPPSACGLVYLCGGDTSDTAAR